MWIVRLALARPYTFIVLSLVKGDAGPNKYGTRPDAPA